VTLIDGSRIAEIAQKFALLMPTMDERQTRLWLAAEAKALGRGGLAAVTTATGVLRKRIGMGIRELEQMARKPPQEPPAAQRIRSPGAGRKKLTDKDATLVDDLESLVAPETRGDPESLLRWTTKSVRKLADQLCEMGHSIGRQKVSELLHELGYSLQSLSKTREGTSHPDRDAQFRHINRKAREFQARGEPVISVDTKKKELIGDFHINGQEWQPKGKPETVRTHDFIDRDLGKAIPPDLF
jgi:transposase